MEAAIWPLRLLTAGIYASLPYLIFTVTEPLGGWFADKMVHRGYSETMVRKSIVSFGSLFGLLLIPATRRERIGRDLADCRREACGVQLGPELMFPQGYAPKDQVGAWAGLADLVANLAGVVAPLATGFMAARTDSYTPGFTLGALILVAKAFSYWFVLGELKPLAREA